MPHNLFFNEPSHIRPYPPSAIMSLLNVVDEGDPTLYYENFKYRFRSLNFYHRDLFQFQFEVSVAPQKFIIPTFLKILGKFLGLIQIKSIKRTEYRIILEKK